MKTTKPIFKKWWFWALVICFIIGSISPSEENEGTTPTTAATVATEVAEITEEIETTEATETEPSIEVTEAATSAFADFIEAPLTDLMEKVEELGYTATYLADGVDFTDFIDALKEDYLVGGVEEDPDAKTIVVDLLLKSAADHNKAEVALMGKLETGAAWVAVENYGEETFGDFELHYLIGKIEEYAEDDTTWFLKAECTIAGIDMICEAKVTGTTENPEVIFFDVY